MTYQRYSHTASTPLPFEIKGLFELLNLPALRRTEEPRDVSSGESDAEEYKPDDPGSASESEVSSREVVSFFLLSFLISLEEKRNAKL